MPTKVLQSKPQVIPKLRFKGFSNIWEEKKFGKLFSFKSTNSFSRENLNYEKGYIKNIHYGDIHTKFKTHFDITKEAVPFVNSNIISNAEIFTNYCKEGDLIIADASEDYADIGKCIEIINLNSEKVLAGLHTLHARPDQEMVCIGFSGHIMKSRKVRLQIMTIAQGTKVLGISTGRLSNILLKIPQIPEQKKISEFLNVTDEWIENLKLQKEYFDFYKKGILQKILKQEICFKDNNGKDFSSWNKTSLGKLIKESILKTTKSNEHRVLSSTMDGIYLQSEYFNKSIASFDNTGYKIVKKNQLVFSPQNLWLGNINVCTNFDIGIVSPSYKIFDINNKLITVDYFKNIIRQPRMLYEYEISSEQGASVVRRSLNIDLFNAIPVNLPSLKEQEKIADFLNSIDEMIELKEQQITLAEQWKKGLMQRLFI